MSGYSIIILNRQCLKQIEVFIQSSDLMAVLNDMRTGYDICLRVPGTAKFKDISNAGTMIGCFTEVYIRKGRDIQA